MNSKEREGKALFSSLFAYDTVFFLAKKIVEGGMENENSVSLGWWSLDAGYLSLFLCVCECVCMWMCVCVCADSAKIIKKSEDLREYEGSSKN